ncbi:MAG: triple tyrosine motif-containing protein [Candidatus Solibacter sp.]|nr:triple tyrosine motif-containing protein [Candidatus Solibacter sp.]
MRFVGIACLLAMASTPCFALNPSRLISQIQKHHWQIEDGLPHNYVNAIAHAADGYLLIGTDEGLARFDGVRFSPAAVDPALHLDRRWIMSLVPSRQGGFWLGTYDGVIYRIEDGRVKFARTVGATVQGLFEDSSGALWFDSGGIHRLANDKLEDFPHCGGNLGNAWAMFADDGHGSIWIAGINGLGRFRNGGMQQVLSTAGREGAVLTVMAESAGAIWAGTSRGLYRVVETAGNVRLSAQPGVSGMVSTLLRDRDGVLWAGTWGRGIWRITAQGVSPWSSRDGLADDFVRTLFEDREGNLWFGSRSGGLNRWKDTMASPFGIPEGLAGNFASTVSGDARGNLWMGTYRSGLYRLQDGVPARQRTPVPKLDLVIGALAHDSGSLWVGSWGGLFRYDDRGYASYSGQLPSGCAGPLAIAFDPARRLWLGCSSGLYRFPAGEPRRETAIRLLQGTAVRSILTAADGTIWAGSSAGLAHIAGDRVELLQTTQGLPDNSVRHVSEDSAKRIWFTTDTPGLSLVAGNSIRTLDARNGLPAHPLYKPLDDGTGTLWVSSSRGILELPGPQVEDWIAGRRDKIEVIVHDMDDGLRSIECHGVSQPGGWLHTDGTLWFPTVKGFVRIEPRGRKQQAPPEVRIEEATSGSRPLALGEIRLSPGARDLQVRFTALRFGSPDHVRFRYRLEGSDRDWMETGSNRTAGFTSLPPGKYRLLVSARDDAGVWNTQPAALSIEQLPYFHETLLFKVLLAAAIAALGALLYRRRVQALKGRYASIIAERKRIAREWHDTLLGGLSGVSWQLQATRLRMIEHPEQAPHALDTAQRMVEHCQAEARRVIWDLRESAAEDEPLPAAVASFLSRQREGTAIQGTMETRGQYAKLPYDIEHSALRLGQEAIANAVRHAQPSRISVLLEYTAEQLMLQVTDDGKGFLPEEHAETQGHFGILGMRERLLNFGGEFHIESSPGAGTVVQACFPLGRKPR